jgi:hypothetical protein
MILAPTAACRAIMLVAAASSGSVAAQTTAPAKIPSAAPAWTISSVAGSGAVEVSATANDGVSRLVIGCSRSDEPGLTGVFSGYRGAGLRTDGQIEPLSLFANGEEWRETFSVRLRYVAASRAWEFATPLSPLFLRSFSRGATLSVINARNAEVLTFDLTGSTAATRAMRGGCGLAD